MRKETLNPETKKAIEAIHQIDYPVAFPYYDLQENKNGYSEWREDAISKKLKFVEVRIDAMDILFRFPGEHAGVTEIAHWLFSGHLRNEIFPSLRVDSSMAGFIMVKLEDINTITPAIAEKIKNSLDTLVTAALIMQKIDIKCEDLFTSKWQETKGFRLVAKIDFSPDSNGISFEYETRDQTVRRQLENYLNNKGIEYSISGNFLHISENTNQNMLIEMVKETREPNNKLSHMMESTSSSNRELYSLFKDTQGTKSAEASPGSTEDPSKRNSHKN